MFECRKCIFIYFVYLERKHIIQMQENATWNNDCNINQLNTLKNKDIVFLKHFEDMASIYIIKNVQLFNEVMIFLNSIHSCKFLHFMLILIC